MGCTLTSGKSSRNSNNSKRKGTACASNDQNVFLETLLPKDRFSSSIYLFESKKTKDGDSKERAQSAVYDLSQFRDYKPSSCVNREERLAFLKTGLTARKGGCGRRNGDERGREDCPHFLFCKYIDKDIELNLSRENVFEAKKMTLNITSVLEKTPGEDHVEISQVFRESTPGRTASLGFCRCLPNKSFELNTSDFPDYQILGEDLGV